MWLWQDRCEDSGSLTLVTEVGQALHWGTLKGQHQGPPPQQESPSQEQRQQAHLLGQIQQQEEKCGSRFSVWIFRQALSEEESPDLHLLYLSVLLDRRLVLLSILSSSFPKPSNIIWSPSRYFYWYLLPQAKVYAKYSASYRCRLVASPFPTHSLLWPPILVSFHLPVLHLHLHSALQTCSVPLKLLFVGKEYR